ncbi:MAG: flavodoxin family protein [Methanospirillum sp.]
MLALYRDDLSSALPGMVRYLLLLEREGRTIVLFSTNTYEYPPLLPLDAERAARQAAADWEAAILAAPEGLVRPTGPPVPHAPVSPGGVLVLQGSPRPDGSCAVLAGWAAEAAASVGRPVEVVFVHDLEIRPCIGCYQCYNTGDCTFDDDMTPLAFAIRAASLLVVCSPVYTNTVPAGLKAAIDRAQAIHAGDELRVYSPAARQTGVLLATAGRKGPENFDCVRSVVRAFMANLGIRSGGEVLVDDLDALRDLRGVPGLELRVRSTVISALSDATVFPTESS